MSDFAELFQAEIVINFVQSSTLLATVVGCKWPELPLLIHPCFAAELSSNMATLDDKREREKLHKMILCSRLCAFFYSKCPIKFKAWPRRRWYKFEGRDHKSRHCIKWGLKPQNPVVHEESGSFSFKVTLIYFLRDQKATRNLVFSVCLSLTLFPAKQPSLLCALGISENLRLPLCSMARTIKPNFGVWAPRSSFLS